MDEKRSLGPRQEILPAAPPITERHIIDLAVTAPQATGIFGLIERMRRGHRAIVAERSDTSVPQVRQVPRSVRMFHRESQALNGPRQ
jgi:hypothetical protein